MSKLVILLTVFIAVICGAEVVKNVELPSGKVCAAGSSWKSQCNDCKCSNDGLPLCTRAQCSGDEPDPLRDCAPDTVWKDDCNTCWCSNGKAACTLMGCINLTSSKKYELPSGKNCAPGSSWKSQCNICMCTDSGLAACTRKKCTGNEPDPIRDCAPNTTWKNDCNTCVCSDGKAACTLMACSTEPPSQCLEPIEVGPCRMAVISYAYNSTTKKCEKFIYGGCKGNSNRFDTESECQIACNVH